MNAWRAFLSLLPFLLLLSLASSAQTAIYGVVNNKKGDPIFAANVYLKSDPQHGVTTDFDGKFSLDIRAATWANDTLIVSFIGYQTTATPCATMDIAGPVAIVLKGNLKALEEVIITGQDPISERFSVVKMDKMDIYLNPVSQADPLKAITVLPASTTTDETAEVSLRGSAAGRSRVIFNKVPIYSPTRANNLNSQGFFSLFNPEMIGKQYVYASNPPLTYGNTSAGLVEIQTMRELASNQLHLSASLASVGFLVSQQIKKDVAFVQAYGNYQFSGAFVGIQPDRLPDIDNFSVKDVGINVHGKIGKRCEVNSYTYYIDESFRGSGAVLAFREEASSFKKRVFTINNFSYYAKKGILSVNSGVSDAIQELRFGNTFSAQKTRRIYTSIDYTWYPLEGLDLQFGAAHDYQRRSSQDSIPTYYYALQRGAPNNFLATSAHNHILDVYAYAHWDMSDKFAFLAGVRSNVPVEAQAHYASGQLGVKYYLDKDQSFLLSGGKYHNYAAPNFSSRDYTLQASYQVALDYSRALKNTLIKAAAYFKNETEAPANGVFVIAERINTFGLEVYAERDVLKYVKVSFANSFIDQRIRVSDKDYKGANDFAYLIKSTIQYNHPKLFSLSLTYIGRPGTPYNEITGSTLDARTNFYEPVFSSDLNRLRFANYNRVDISVSKYIRTKKSAFIPFAIFNNIFDIKNQRIDLYSRDYSVAYFDPYLMRTVYVGVVWQLRH